MTIKESQWALEKQRNPQGNAKGGTLMGQNLEFFSSK
jgi:hypothetical protein